MSVGIESATDNTDIFTATAGEIKSDIKSKLWEELRVKADLCINGVDVSEEALVKLRQKLGVELQEQVYDLYLDRHNQAPLFPFHYITPHGLIVSFQFNNEAKYRIESEGDKFIVASKGNKVFDITFPLRPKYYGKKVSDGSSMANIAILLCGDCLGVCYSNECSLKEKGEDCLFCSINKGNREVFWKNTKQIAEAVAEAYCEGVATKIHFTGGIIPERRELDYYIDAMEAINLALPEGNDLIAIANCAAPIELDYLDKLKEQGFKSAQMNLEIWDKNYYKTVCPGKSNRAGGWEHWVSALEYGAKVFGFGYVGSNLVVGIEPKFKTIEGIEYLSSKGVVTSISHLRPMDDTAFEGMALQNPEWVLDISYKQVEIQKKNGLTYGHLYSTTARKDAFTHDIYRIQDELLPVFNCYDYEPKVKIF